MHHKTQCSIVHYFRILVYHLLLYFTVCLSYITINDIEIETLTF